MPAGIVTWPFGLLTRDASFARSRLQPMPTLEGVNAKQVRVLVWRGRSGALLRYLHANPAEEVIVSRTDRAVASATSHRTCSQPEMPIRAHGDTCLGSGAHATPSYCGHASGHRHARAATRPATPRPGFPSHTPSPRGEIAWPQTTGSWLHGSIGTTPWCTKTRHTDMSLLAGMRVLPMRTHLLLMV